MLYSSICNLQELDDMLREYDMKRDSVEIDHNAPEWSHNAVWNRNTWNRRQDTHCGNFGLTPSRPLGRNLPSYEVKDGDIRRAVAAIADLPSSTLPSSPFIRIGDASSPKCPPQTRTLAQRALEEWERTLCENKAVAIFPQM